MGTYSHTSSGSVLKNLYKDVFRQIKERADVYTSHEYASIPSIDKKARYSLSDEFAVELNCADNSLDISESPPDMIQYRFFGDVSAMKKYPENTSFLCAHEVKHASLYTTASQGKINIEKISFYTQNLKYYIPKKLWSFCSKTLNRQTEFWCDDFALRTFPDQNLESFRDYMYELSGEKRVTSKKTALGRFAQNISLYLKDMLSGESYPHPERRYQRMKKLQDKLER